MPKFFAVELSVIAIIEVPDDATEMEAQIVAEDERHEIFSDCDQPDTMVVQQIKAVKDLAQYGWDGICLPYGGDGNTPLQYLLPAE